MHIRKAIGRRPSVIYRWLRRRRILVHAVTMASVLVVLPLGIASGVHLSRFIASNGAWAATRADLPRESALIASRAFSGRPENIEKLRETDFLALFREPDLDRREGATKIWQYRADSCVLDIYFDETAERETAGRVIHYEMRPRLLAAFGKQEKDQNRTGVNSFVDSAACLKEIARGGRA